MKPSLRVYLCGSIQKGSDDKRSSFWFDEDIRELREAADPVRFVLLNPAHRSDDLSDVRATFGRDLLQVFSSGVVIADARAKRGVGVGAELLFAKSHRIPVVAIVPPNSHYHRSDVTLMGQFVKSWVHPFISELSDAVVATVADAAHAAIALANGGAIRGPECFHDAMVHYLKTQSDREADMVSLLVEEAGAPARAIRVREALNERLSVSEGI